MKKTKLFSLIGYTLQSYSNLSPIIFIILATQPPEQVIYRTSGTLTLKVKLLVEGFTNFFQITPELGTEWYSSLYQIPKLRQIMVS